MRIALVLVAATIMSSAATAQEEQFQEYVDPIQNYWINTLYPKIFYSAKNGLTVGGYLAWIQPLTVDQYFDPPPYQKTISLNAQVSTSGSWLGRAEFRAPIFSDGWRVLGRLEGQRQHRDNYFGLGPETVYDGDSVTASQPNFYEAEHVRLIARIDIQRQIVGPLRLLVGTEVQRWKIGLRSGPSVLAQDLANNLDPTIDRSTNEVIGRVGLVVDTRDDEVLPGRGILVEAIGSGADQRVASDVSYTRLKVSAQGYVPLGPRFNLAARILGQATGGEPGIGTRYQIDASEDPFAGLGGGRSHRALADHRFLGDHTLLGNLEARFLAFGLPPLAYLYVVGFVDAGRVFQSESFRLTTDGLETGGGGGLLVRIGRAAMIGFTAGVGPDGLEMNFQSRWTF